MSKPAKASGCQGGCADADRAWCGQYRLSGCSRETRRLFCHDGYWIRKCEACGHRFAEIDPGVDHVDKVYSRRYFFGGRDGYPDYLREKSLLVAQGADYARLLARHTEPGRVLDVGAAAGFILAGFEQAGWTGVGIEPNRQMAEHAQAHLDLDVQVGSLEEFRSREQFDLVSMIQVLPHFYDLRDALCAASDHTRPGGYWLVETWDRTSWFARLSGQNWHEYSPPSVLHWFSAKDLHRLMAQYGFDEVARGRPRKRIALGHAKSLLEHKLAGARLGKVFVAVLGLLPDSLSVPYPGDDVFWALYRKRTNRLSSRGEA